MAFKKGDLITASGLNVINKGDTNLPVLNESWWPYISGIQANKVYNASGYYFHIATWYRGSGGDTSIGGYPSWTTGWFIYPPDKNQGIWLNAGAKAMFRYWYDPNAWTNGGGYRWKLQRKENGSWTTVDSNGEDNRKGGRNFVINISKSGYYRGLIAIESTYWSSDGSVGYMPASSKCIRGDFLKCIENPVKLGPKSASGTPLTTSVLNSGKIYTTKE